MAIKVLTGIAEVLVTTQLGDEYLFEKEKFPEGEALISIYDVEMEEVIVLPVGAIDDFIEALTLMKETA